MTTPTTEQQTATEFKGVLEIKRTLIAGAKFELTGTALSERWFKAVKQYQLLNGFPTIKESISSAMFQAGFATSETASKKKNLGKAAATCADDYDIENGFVFVKPDAPLGKSTLERWNSNMVSIEKGARGGKLEATPMSKFDSFSQVQAFYKSVPAGASKKKADPKQPGSNEATIDDVLKYVEKFSSKTMRDFVEMRMRASKFEGTKMDIQLANFLTTPTTEETVSESDAESDAIDAESEVIREVETVFELPLVH
jgi:hypothetical protein